jgi:hypothetical protein
MLSPRNGFVKFDFLKFLRPQIGACISMHEAVRMVLSQFTRFNERNLGDTEMVGKSLEILIVFLEEVEGDNMVSRELQLVRLYKSVFRELADQGDAESFTSSPGASDLDSIYHIWKSRSVEYDFSDFFDWLKESGLGGRLVVPDNTVTTWSGQFSPDSWGVSYREFSLEGWKGACMIFSLLLAAPEDPFMAKFVATTWMEYCGIMDMDGAGMVQNWLASVLGQYMPSQLVGSSC